LRQSAIDDGSAEIPDFVSCAAQCFALARRLERIPSGGRRARALENRECLGGRQCGARRESDGNAHSIGRKGNDRTCFLRRPFGEARQSSVVDLPAAVSHVLKYRGAFVLRKTSLQIGFASSPLQVSFVELSAMKSCVVLLCALVCFLAVQRYDQ